MKSTRIFKIEIVRKNEDDNDDKDNNSRKLRRYEIVMFIIALLYFCL